MSDDDQATKGEQDTADPEKGLVDEEPKLDGRQESEGEAEQESEGEAEQEELSEEEQATYYHQLLWGVHTRGYLEKVFPYEIRDDPNAGVPPWGIVRADYSPKEAYYTYRDFITAPSEPPTPNPCGVGLASPGGGGANLAVFLLVLGWIGMTLARVKEKG